MAAVTDPHAQLAEAALRLLRNVSWRDVTLMQVARAAKLDAGALHSVAPNKPALLGCVLHWIGGETARRYRRDMTAQDARDRLLDVALTWFEVLNPYKPAIRALHDGLKRDPLTLIAARAEIVGAAEWLLTLAEADTGGVLPVRALAVAGALARAIPLWLDDDAEMTQTMARLDGDLSRADSLLNRSRSREPHDEMDQPPRPGAAAAGKATRKAGTRRRSRAKNPARRGR